MNEDLYLIRKVDANFVKESFLTLYEKNKNDIDQLIKNFAVLNILAHERDWLEGYIKGIIDN